MLVTFGATFLGVIASFILWYGGQWWIKRISNQNTVKHMLREIRAEVLRNIEILGDCEKGISTMIGEKNIPVYLPFRMKLHSYRRFVLSGELRLVDDERREWIDLAGWYAESWNEFIDNTEMVLVMRMQKPYAVEIAHMRLGGLVEQAKANISSLRVVMENIGVSKDNRKEEKGVNQQK